MKLITGPATEPLTLSEVKQRLSIEDTYDDADITAYIQAAREQAEVFMGQAIITQTHEIGLDAWPNEIELYNPVQAITSIKYLDSDGTEQTLATSEYELDTHTDVHRVVLAYNSSWPTARNHTNSIKVRFVSGWGDADAVPEDIKTALLLAIGHWVRFQAVAESGIGPTRLPYQFYDLLRHYRRVAV